MKNKIMIFNRKFQIIINYFGGLILCLLVILLTNCRDKKEDCHYHITIKNSTAKEIYYYIQVNYPDTSIGSYNPIGSPYDYKIIANSEKQALHGHNECFEEDFKIYSTLECFLFDANTLITVPWDTIRKKYLILKRYDLTIIGLQNSNWEITYP